MTRFSLKPAVLTLCGLWIGSVPALAGVAKGDFNGDGYADLAVGVPYEDINGVEDGGAVNVIYGSSSGLTATGDQFWHQDSPGIEGVAETSDYFGTNVAAGDFNGDGFDDLAVGVSKDDVNGLSDAGVVNVLYGSSSGLTDAGNQLWHQAKPGILGVLEVGDCFGGAVGTGDFNGDGFDDLAVSAPLDDVNGLSWAGVVNVLYGSSSGLTDTGNQLWNQDSPGIEGVAAAYDAFGTELAVRDFNGDGFADLGVGSFADNESGAFDAGAVNVLYGSPTGLTDTGDQLWHQDSPGISGAAEPYDFFGSHLAARDFNGDGFEDLAVAVPGEDVGTGLGGGAVNVLYGSSTGLNAAGNQLWHQDSPGMAGTAQAGDSFGSALAARDFNGDGFADLAVGVPGEDLGSLSAGAVNVLYGSPSGLTASGELWHQDSVGIVGTAEADDWFGWQLAAGDFDGDGFVDLAVAAPKDDIGGVADAGAVNVIHGSSTGLTATGNQFWHQDSPGILGTAQAHDYFGSANDWFGY